MIKVLVFDSGRGVEIMGNYIEKEMPVQVEEVISEIDYEHASDTKLEIRDAVERQLAPYIGEVDVIVLADPRAVVAAGRYLKRRFPRQKFVLFGWDLPGVINEAGRVLMLTPREVRAAEVYQMAKAKCQEQEIRELDCEEWIKLVQNGNINTLNDRFLREIKDFVGAKIVINCSELMIVEETIRKVVGWRAEIVDMRASVVRGVEECLGMR